MFLRKLKNSAIRALLLVLFLGWNAYAANVMQPDSYAFWIVNNIVDNSAPILSGCSPDANVANVACSTNIKVCVFDAQSAIDSSSIDMSVNGEAIISNGNVQTYQDIDNNTREYQVEIVEKTANEYILMYDPVEYFNYEETVSITVSAIDYEGNSLNGYSYNFRTQDFLIGSFSSFLAAEPVGATVSAQLADAEFMQDNSVIASSASGKNVFMAWEQRNSSGAWDIYCVRSNDFGEIFEVPVRVNPDAEGAEQRFPSIALDDLNNVYVSWQQKTIAGDWDIYIGKMDNDENMFSPSRRIYADYSATNQLSPAITVGPALTNDGQSSTLEPATLYAVWVEDNGTSSSVRYNRTTSSYSDAWNIFVGNSIRIDSDRWPQQCKDSIIKLDASGRVFVAWRGENMDNTSSIYFDLAAKNITDGGESFGTDIIVSNRTSGAIAPDLEVMPDGNNVYLLWKELLQAQANLKFSYYCYSSGAYILNASRIVNADILSDDDLGSYDLSIDNRDDATALWSEVHDSNRIIKMAYAGHSAYAFSEIAFIGTVGVQQNPSLGMAALGGHYYVSWTDDSSGHDALYFCRNTYIVTDEITSQNIDNVLGGTIIVTQGNIAGTIIDIPSEAIDAPITIFIAESVGVPDLGNGMSRVGNVIDFGPGQTQFNIPARITLPYNNNTHFDLTAIDEESLNIFYYNIGGMNWEMVQGSVVDTANKTVSASIAHFSMYMVADGAPVMPSGSSSASGGGCFIATAAFGTSMAQEVNILCEFRDLYLLNNIWGRKFVKFYYKYSPPIADKIRECNELKVLIRVCLKPLVWLSNEICR